MRKIRIQCGVKKYARLFVRTPQHLLCGVLIRTYLEELPHGEVVESVTAVEHHTLLGEGFGEVLRCLCLACNNQHRHCVLGVGGVIGVIRVVTVAVNIGIQGRMG